jgi:SAM-dependent methyltransferase
MDRQTVDFYNANSAETAQRYAEAASTVAQFFPIAFPAGKHVLDIGCGSGRDLNALIQAGYSATGIDASESMIKAAESRFPRLAGKLRFDHLPELRAVASFRSRKPGIA